MFLYLFYNFKKDIQLAWKSYIFSTYSKNMCKEEDKRYKMETTMCLRETKNKLHCTVSMF